MRRVPGSIQLVALVLALYVFLYNPIFIAIGIGSIKILLLACLAYAAFNPKVVLLLRRFRNEAFFTVCLIIYAAFAAARSPDTVSHEAYLHAVWFLESIVIPITLVHGFRRVLARYDWEMVIVLTGSVAAVITLVLISMPDWNQFVRTRLIAQSLDPEEWWFRGFAIAEGASFSYGIIQGLVVGICLWCVKRSKLYALPVLPLLISILFNARTGLVVVLISMLLLLASRRVSLRLVWMLTLTVSAGIAVDRAVGFTERNAGTIGWVTSAFNDTKRLVSGDRSSDTYSQLFGEMLVVPSTLGGVLLGERASPGAAAIQQVSDIGYVNELFFGGTLYIGILLGCLAYMYARVRRRSGHCYYPLLFVATLLLANVKWVSLFVPSGFFRLFCLFYVYTLLSQKRRLAVTPGSGSVVGELVAPRSRQRARSGGRHGHRVHAAFADSPGLCPASAQP